MAKLRCRYFFFFGFVLKPELECYLHDIYGRVLELYLWSTLPRGAIVLISV